MSIYRSLYEDLTVV